MKSSATCNIPSARALAIALDRHPATVGRWIARDDWTFGTAPWRKSMLPKIREWMESALDARNCYAGKNPELPELRKAKLRASIRVLDGQIATMEAQLANTLGTLHDSDACDRQRHADQAVIDTAFGPIPAEITQLAVAQGMPSESAHELHALVTGLVVRAIGGDGAYPGPAPARGEHRAGTCTHNDPKNRLPPPPQGSHKLRGFS